MWQSLFMSINRTEVIHDWTCSWPCSKWCQAISRYNHNYKVRFYFHGFLVLWSVYIGGHILTQCGLMIWPVCLIAIEVSHPPKDFGITISNDLELRKHIMCVAPVGTFNLNQPPIICRPLGGVPIDPWHVQNRSRGAFRVQSGCHQRSFTETVESTFPHGSPKKLLNIWSHPAME